MDVVFAGVNLLLETDLLPKSVSANSVRLTPFAHVSLIQYGT